MFLLQKTMSSEKEYTPALRYRWLTGFYDLVFRLMMPESRLRNQLVETCSFQQGEQVLEFGFGTGQNLVMAFRRTPGIELSGLDIDKAIYGIASQKMKKLNIPARLSLYDGMAFPFRDHSFDKVYSFLVFHHLDAEGKKTCLKEIQRVLKPGGKLILGDWGKARSGWLRFAYLSVQLLDGFKTTGDNVKGKIPEYLRGAGFSNVSETGYINTLYGTCSYYVAEKKL